MEGTKAKAQMVAGRIRPMLRDGMSPKEIGSKLSEIFPRDIFNFSILREVDKILCNENGGGFWMSAFNYPKVGDVVRARQWGGVIRVVSVGIFTFEGNVVNAENNDDDPQWPEE